MADITFTINTALAEVAVNSVPLVDATTGATIQTAVAYNAAGLTLFWHFVTIAGAHTVTAVTPTTAGVHDWAAQSTSGIYTLEIPASAGTINNNAAGFGWFTGVATGILPWRSPIYGFIPANVNNSLVTGVEWLEVTNLAPKVGIAGSTITVYKQDDTTAQFTADGTFTANADTLTQLAGKT